MLSKPQNISSNPQKKSFLLLQGVASPFFNELEKELIKHNQQCFKINFCGGDLFSGAFFTKAKNHLNYQGTLEDLPEFYTFFFKQHQITDIALFGDTRPVHLAAIEIAKSLGITIHVFEEGYFRPNRVTLDKDGVNAFSHIYRQSQNQADWFLENANDEHWQDKTEATGGNLLIRAWHDIRYHLVKTLFKAKFPHYKTHRPDSPLDEYWGFIRRIPLVHFHYNKKSNQQIQALLTERTPFYLLPLQLDADSQIRLHSPFNSLADVIEATLNSFAQFAPEDAKLVVKLHPLDPWFINYQDIIELHLGALNIDRERVIYLEGGNLNTLLEHCVGTVLVNSTVGTSALEINTPVIALGSSIYNIEGLTFQGSLDEFWHQAFNGSCKPDKTLFAAFKQCYIKHTQINGSFYNRKGITMAAKASIPLLLKNNENTKD